MKPLLMLDVDGVLNIDVSNSRARKAGFKTWHLSHDRVGRVRVVLNLDHPIMLGRLAPAFEIVWASMGWPGPAAFEWARQMRLPFGPSLTFPGGPSASKVDDILRFAQGRPLAWVDDESRPGDLDRLVREHRQPALLVSPEPDIGLTWEHVTALLEWVRNLPNDNDPDAD